MPRIIGETSRERNERQDTRDELNRLQRKLGNREYIDPFTTVPDNRTTDEILSRVPKCVAIHRMKQEQKDEPGQAKRDD